ncbi:MAG: hypothetical protein KGI38_07155 [Thaumarchaeota archaeon]|nr:hypothetical protein [Nitrososphaerota archaeon]
MSQPDFKARVILEATVSPSEDSAKVVKAIQNIIGETSGSVSVGPLSARLVSEDPRALVRVRDQLRDRHVRAVARKQLLFKKVGHATSMMLNRQAAAAGVVAICGSPEESPLGPIYITIASDRIDAVIDWLTAHPEG